MMGEMDFSDKWFRKTFRGELLRKTWNTGGEYETDTYRRVANYLTECNVTLSASGKMAYDHNLNANNLTNLSWWGRTKFMDWARVKAPEVIKKRGAKPATPEHNGRVTTPKPKAPPKPTTTGWDDFDWSR